MNITKILFLLIILPLFPVNIITSQSISGRDIINMVKDRPNGDTRYSELTMQLINKRRRIRERKIKSYSMDIGEDKKTLMFFQYPGDVKGTGFLTWDYDEIGKDDDKWLYLPAMKKTRRISGSSAKTDYFMGSDFTYDDMGSRNVDEDTHSLVGEENIDDNDCWIVESVSKDIRDIYSKKTSWIRKDCLIPVKVEYYDKLGKLHRIFEQSKIQKVDGFWIALEMNMENVQTSHKTRLIIENPKFNIDINEKLFTVSKLEKGHF